MTARLKGEDKVFREDRPDFLQYFIESMSTHPDIVDAKQIIGYLLLNCSFAFFFSPSLLPTSRPYPGANFMLTT